MSDLAEQAIAGTTGNHVQAAVADAVRRWRSNRSRPDREASSLIPFPGVMLSPQTPTPLPPLEKVLRPLPRRETAITTPLEVRLPPIHEVSFRAGLLVCIKRLFVWLGLIVHLVAGAFVDRLRGKDTVHRRAVRLREALERVGGTFVKVGQQVAMRIDLVPWDYCVELSKMLDRMPPFPAEQALAVVERAIGKPWQDVFSVFDPEPVGSASIACVFQAHLRDGTKVAVKVRRPGIGELFTADFRVLDWLLGFAEWLAILRPGMTGNLRREFRETLFEELDFRKEARFQHIFRRNARKSGERFVTAPKVYFDLSNDNVLVQEFVSGMWLWELITAVEQRDPEGTAMMRQLNIDPKLVARRILRASFWSMDENLFFHADPHPANIVAGQDSTLTFVDFGSCGSFNAEQGWSAQRLSHAMEADDAEGMARATLKMMEPLPPLDISAVLKEAQEDYIRVLYTFRTKAEHTEWWERTSAKLWMSMVRVARQYNLPVNLGTLRMIRATLLYDTLAVRLDRTVDRFKDYRDFTRDRGKWAKKRWRKRMRDARRQFVMGLESMSQTGGDLLERAQQTIASPIARFTSLIDKGMFAFSVLARMAGRLLLLTAMATATVAAASYLRTGATPGVATLSTVAGSTLFRLLVAIMVVLNVRHILFRVRDRDIRK
jgi:ubiquinone biosynthesis protein